MKGFVANTRRVRGRALGVFSLAVITGLLAWLPAPASAGSGPGTWTQSDVNAAIANGVAFYDANQNASGSWGTSVPGADTSLALASYGVLDGGHYANLSPAQQTRVNNGLAYLLGTQGSNGSFNGDSGYPTYDTGLALIALSLNTDNPTYGTQIATAITNGRNYLIGEQNVTANGVSCSGPTYPSDNYCGGWNYSGPTTRSDESNTGFALTGLDVTGGVPTAVATPNINWQRSVQNLYADGTTNNAGGFPSRNDGGGSYQPSFVGNAGGDAYVSSNANDSGSLLFGLGYDKIPASDPAVVAAIKFGNDVLDTYELNKSTREMVYHTGTNEDGSCQIGATGCDWQFAPTFEGGYHYSLFALVKGLSQFSTPDLTDPNNFYAKAVDLLLSQQNSDGSWPYDGRDDGYDSFGATGFAILALGKVGAPVEPITASGTSLSATEGQSFSGTVATVNDPNSGSEASEFTATINWGDGTTSSGTVSGSNGNYTVSGSHTYAEEGSYTVTTTVTKTYRTSSASTATESATATSPTSVADAALHATGVAPAVSSGTASGTVATFTDSDPGGTLSDYTATISWGDGATSSGTVSAASGSLRVTGTHKYAKSGKYTVTITIKDVGGSTATATTTVTIPTAHVKAARVKRGSARLSVPNACVSGAFNAQVSGSQIASVRFSLDGSAMRGRTVSRGNRYSARITLSRGSHALSVHVKFRSSSRTPARTFARTVSACSPPAFTG